MLGLMESARNSRPFLPSPRDEVIQKKHARHPLAPGNLTPIVVTIGFPAKNLVQLQVFGRKLEQRLTLASAISSR